jgi:hypothetical protein
MTKLVVGGVVAVLLVGGGTVALAQNSLPGDLLYGVKLGVLEKVDSTFAGSGKARAEWHIKMADRRLQEAVDASLEEQFDNDAEAAVLANFNMHMKGIEEYIAAVNAEGNVAATKDITIKLAQVLAQKTEILTQAQGFAKQSENPEVQGSVDFLLLRVTDSLAAAAGIAVGTLIEDPAPTPEVDPSTVDEWGRPI